MRFEFDWDRAKAESGSTKNLARARSDGLP
jgi:hypothetical protein